ncbi:hypothetical protein PN498_10170 [Oscillatoria sp. CS-180]|uniref:hypothetical protein n=1 Tax=Oscillatoria sp. CS-180 TaxID=3021720 RepID=UPI00232B3AF4|nr:hypothetical protein [Oscillatoria sp. CS-180]MDB9526352.1 hypothetical protein [Oscillatoria sp. CS-180]
MTVCSQDQKHKIDIEKAGANAVSINSKTIRALHHDNNYRYETKLQRQVKAEIVPTVSGIRRRIRPRLTGPWKLEITVS